MENKIIFNADDFGISRGVNQAISEAARDGILNSASVMVNQKYAAEAVAIKQELPNLELGLHVNLTNEYPAADPCELPLLVGSDNKFKNGFVKLMLLSFFKTKAFKEQVYKEVEAQILKAKELGIDIKHIDSHRHVHMIPAVFSAFKDDHSEFSSALPADDLRTTIPYFFQPVDLSRNAIADRSARAFCGKESVFFPALEAVIRSR